MKKNVCLLKLFVFGAVFVFSCTMFSCSTIMGFFDSVKQKIAGSDNEIASNNDDFASGGTLLPLPFGNVGSNTNTAQTRYPLPENYDKAYSYRTGKYYPKMKTMSKEIDALRGTNPNQYVSKVCAIIEKEATNDFEKVKMANDHIACLVSYDAKNFWAGTVPEQNYENVLRTKTAVCEGYANCVQKFLSTLSIECHKVTGYARGVGVEMGSEGDVTASNHAWNICKIEDAWYILDCTWNSGYMNGRQSVQSYSTEWLFVKPNHFIYTHLPSSAKDQLLEKPFSATEFKALPFFRPSFFDIAQDCNLEEKLSSVEGNLCFSYACKEGYYLSFQVVDGGREVKNCVSSFKNDDNTTTTIQFPQVSSYNVTIFYFQDGKRNGWECAQFMVKSTKASTIKYAEVYSIAKNTQLIFPLETPLLKGETYSFSVKSSDYKTIALISGKNFVPFENDDDSNFRLNYTIPENATGISVGCAKGTGGNYNILARYTVK